MNAIALEAPPEILEDTIEMTTPLPAPMPLTKKLQEGLCLVQVTVRSSDYRIAMPGTEVKAEDEFGQATTVDPRKITPSKWIWNQHPIFSEVSSNRTKISSLMDLFTVPERTTESDEEHKVTKAGGGYRIMPINQVGQFWARLQELIVQRDEIVQRMKDLWYAEILPGLGEFFGPFFFQVRPSLPKGPHDLAHRFRVSHSFWPLTPLDGSKIDMENLTPQQRQDFIIDQKERIQSMFRDRFESIFDAVLGGISDKCLDILHGELDPKTGLRGKSCLEGGHRQSGTLQQILNVLDKALMFKDVTSLSPEVIKAIKDTREQVVSTDIALLNKNKGNNLVVAGIKSSVAGMSGLVNQMMVQKGRAIRDIAI